MKPNLGAKVPGMEFDTGGISTPNGDTNAPIMKAINNGVGAVANDNTQQQTPQPQWGADTNTNVISDPNKGYQTIIPDSQGAGLNPNTDINAGVPVYNTPSTNQQGAPSFSLNMPYQSSPSSSNLLNTLARGSSGLISSYMGA